MWLKKVVIIFTVTILSSSSLFASENNLKDLINQLRKFQMELKKEGVVNSSQQKNMLSKQIEMLNMKIRYLDTLQDFKNKEKETIEFYKKLIDAYFYDFTIMYKNKKYVFPFLSKIKLFNKNYYIVGKNEYNDLINLILKNKKNFDDIKLIYWSIIKKYDLSYDDVTNFLDKLKSYIYYFNKLGINADYSEKEFLSLKDLPCKKIKEYRKVLILKRCHIE